MANANSVTNELMPITEINAYQFDGNFSIGVKGITLNFFVKHFGKVYIEYCRVENKYLNSHFELSLQTSKRIRAVVECFKGEEVMFFKEYKSWTKKEFKKLSKEAVLNELYCWFVLEYGSMMVKPIQVKEYGKPMKFIYPKKK